jgi:serine/threonine protein kinase
LIGNRPVGLFMLPAHVTGSRSMLAAVQKDFARLRSLEHPNIARLYELGSNGEHFYVTAERLDGESLREVLNHLAPERPSVAEADEIVRAVGAALVYAHEHDIAHGDVRPENVLVTMDRRYVLTNFLARRIAKVPARPPRPSDDLKGLARLAAELYTGSISVHSLRSAVHDEALTVRLQAIRSVLDASSRRPGSVADFLAAAGLAPASPPRPPAPQRAEPKAHRSWSLWRFVVPVAAVAALGTVIAAYQGDVGASAQELTARGLEAFRAVAARVVPELPAGADSSPQTPSVVGTEPQPVTVQSTTEPDSVAAPASTAAAESLVDTEPALPRPDPSGDTDEEQEPEASDAPIDSRVGAEAASVVATPPIAEPPVVSLGVPQIAAREDHSVVAIDVVRSGDTKAEASVGWWTTPDTADEEEDYADVGLQTVRFAAGATVERVLIPIVNDGVRESPERFTVHLGRPRGGVPGMVTATRVTLHDDD